MRLLLAHQRGRQQAASNGSGHGGVSERQSIYGADKTSLYGYTSPKPLTVDASTKGWSPCPPMTPVRRNPGRYVQTSRPWTTIPSRSRRCFTISHFNSLIAHCLLSLYIICGILQSSFPLPTPACYLYQPHDRPPRLCCSCIRHTTMASGSMHHHIDIEAQNLASPPPGTSCALRYQQALG